MDTGLRDRVAIITGAASGIGAATVRALAAEGCLIVGVDRAEFTAPAGIDPSRFRSVGVDVGSEEGAQAVAGAAIDTFGRIDIFVACAGVYETGSIIEVDGTEFDRVLGINVRGAYLGARAALPHMVERGWGRVILFGSMAADTGGSVAAGPAYVTSKAAITGLTRSLTHAAGPDGITVNSIVPGLIDTAMTSVMPDAAKQASIARTPLRRSGTPEDVAAAVVLLASEPLGFVTGAHLDVNGGLVMT